MKGPNLSEWALEHQSFVLYLIVALAIAGVYSYVRLGQAEDPGLHLQDHGGAHPVAGRDRARGRAAGHRAPREEAAGDAVVRLRAQLLQAGESLIFVLLKDYTPPKEVPDAWYQVRKKISDIRHTLPAGVQGPFFNDEFGDTFGTIYAFTSDGYSFAELRDYVDGRARRAAARAGRGEDRHHRRPGREDLHRDVAPASWPRWASIRCRSSTSCSSRTTWCRRATSRPRPTASSCA